MTHIRIFIHNQFINSVIIVLIFTLIFLLIEWIVDSAKKRSTRRFVLFVTISTFILYIFYNRLLREYLPKDLSLPVSYLQQYVYVYIIMINLIILSLLLWEKCKRYLEEAKIEVKREIEQKVSFWWNIKYKLERYTYNIRYELSQSFMNIIYPTWQDEYHRFLIACFIRFNNISFKVKITSFYNILIIPKLIVVSCFLWDVLIKNELNLFYKVLWLLLIPLIFRFVCYNYLIIQNTTIDHIREELDNDPHAFQGSDDDFKNAIKNITEEDLEKASNQAQEFWEREDAAWYKRIFYSFQEFMEDLKEKDGIDYYNYNLKACFLLSDLPLIMKSVAAIENHIKLPLNVFLRIAYIIGWVIIFLQTINK